MKRIFRPARFLFPLTLIVFGARLAFSAGPVTVTTAPSDFSIRSIGIQQGVGLTWSATNATLESRSNLLTGGWAAVPNAPSPYFEIPGRPMNFFRLNFGNMINVPPVAINDLYTVIHDQSLSVAAPGVLGNDIDNNNLPLTATLISGPVSGTLAFNPDGSFVYTPTNGFTGTDSFTYVISDELGGTATAAVTLSAVNHSPTAQPDAYGVQENQTLAVDGPGLLANDTDIDGDALIPTAITLPAHGTLTGSDGTPNNARPDGGFTYTPDNDFSGVDTFTYRDSDGITNGNTVTVTLTVHSNDTPPVATSSSYAMAEGTILAISAPGVLAGATDADGDPLTAVLAATTSNGLLTLAADGSFQYAPNPGYTGMDSFTFQANDGVSNGNTATVTILVTNSQPLAVGSTYFVHAGAVLSVPPSGVLEGDISLSGNPLAAQLVTGSTLGTMELNADGSFDYTNVNLGVDTFTYEAVDASENTTSSPAVVTIVVTNQAPVVVADAYGVHTNLALNVAAPGVLANDFDPDGDSLTAVQMGSPTNGVLTLNGDGSFTYTPNPGFSGTDGFMYAANDGLASSVPVLVTLNVHATNDPPLTAPGVFTIRPDETLVVTNGNSVLDNDLDDDGDPLTATLLSPTANGTLTFSNNGDFVYVPNDGFVGADTFTYQAFDGLVAGSPATVTINVVNTPPFVNPDVYEFHFTTTNESSTNLSYTVDAPGVLENDGDDDQDEITADLVTGTTNGLLELGENGSFVYTPNPGFVGLDSFSYVADDGYTTSRVETVTLQIVDTAPVAQTATYSVNMNTTLTNAAPGILDYAYDDDEDPLTAVLVSTTTNGSLTLNPDGSFGYTPHSGFTGTDQFSYAATDGGLTSAPVAVSISVNGLGLSLSGAHPLLVQGGPTMRMVAFDNFGNTPANALPGAFTPDGKMVFSDWGASTFAENRLKPVGRFGSYMSFGYRWTDLTGNGFIGPIILLPGNNTSIGFPYIYKQGSKLSAAVSLTMANVPAGMLTLTGDIYWDKNFGNVTMVGQNYKLGTPNWTITSAKAWAGNVGNGLTTFNLPFAVASGSFPTGFGAVGRHQMSIVWHYNLGGIEKVCGVSKHTMYLTYAQPRLVYDFWTEVDAGCQAVPSLASLISQNLFARAIFQNTFRSGNLFAQATPSPGNVKRVDGAPLSFYGSAITPAPANARGWTQTSPGWLAPEAFTAPDLLRLGSGWNLGWARLFQEMLLAQGLTDANNNGIGVLTPVTGPKGSGFLLSGTMANRVTPQPFIRVPATTTFVPSAPYAPGNWVYPSFNTFAVTPPAIVPNNAGWKFIFYKNGSYTPMPSTVTAQNSVTASPPNWWYQDWVINVNGTLCDPTYGMSGSIKDMQDKLVDGTFNYIGGVWWTGPPIRIFPTFRMNKAASLRTQALSFTANQPAGPFNLGDNTGPIVITAKSFTGGGAAAGAALSKVRVKLTIWKGINGKNFQVGSIFATQLTGANGTVTFNVGINGANGFGPASATAIYVLVATAPGCADAVSAQFKVTGP